MVKTDKFKKVEIITPGELRRWLLKNHNQAESVWLVTYKKSEGEKYVSVNQVLDELISFGWIDGIRRKLDSERTMQLISPRKSQHWSGTYKERAQKLINARRMHDSGFKSIERSKKLGLWNFLDDVDALIKPKDLQEALARYPNALNNFNNFPPSNQRFILRWIKLSKKDTTRSSRIEKVAKLTSIGEKIPGL